MMTPRQPKPARPWPRRSRQGPAQPEAASNPEAPTEPVAGQSPPAATPEGGSAGEAPISLSFDSSGKKARESKLSKRKTPEKSAAKPAAKLTPRQRRRRWLGSVLQPLKSLKKPLNRLTAYQMLMIGRGQRSQLIKVELDYDHRQLVNMARDVFVPDSHPFARWFAEAAEQALAGGLYSKAESDALAEQDEMAQQKLLEAATDQLASRSCSDRSRAIAFWLSIPSARIRLAWLWSMRAASAW